MGFSDLSDFEAFVPKHLNSLLDYFFKALFILFLLESYLWRRGETQREREKKNSDHRTFVILMSAKKPWSQCEVTSAGSLGPAP